MSLLLLTNNLYYGSTIIILNIFLIVVCLDQFQLFSCYKQCQDEYPSMLIFNWISVVPQDRVQK